MDHPMRLDLTGKIFGRLRVLAVDRFWKRNFWWRCRCECGKEKSIRASRLTAGTTISCGCFRREVVSARAAILGANSATHGATRGGRWTRTYTTWYAMRQRVNNPRHEHFHYYGGRGIKVCKRWNRFENFLADMGERPSKKTLDRINPNGDYRLSNCRWATQLEQLQNRRVA